jgi:hypothetical protein
MALKETDFSKALMIRQSFGRAISAQVRGSQDADKTRLVKYILESMSLLVPKKTDMNPRKLMRIIDQAVSLSNEMTEEQALFLLYMPDVGMDPSMVQYLKIADKTQSGDLFMCTFPAFGRKTVEEGFVCVVEGNVELASILEVEKEGQ